MTEYVKKIVASPYDKDRFVYMTTANTMAFRYNPLEVGWDWSFEEILLRHDYWYYRVDYKPYFEIFRVLQNQLSKEQEIMVFAIDKEGPYDLNDLERDRFIGPVLGPFVGEET